MINDRIKEIRVTKGITQEELLQRLIDQGLKLRGYSNLISKIENRKRRVFADEIILFAIALNVSISDLLVDIKPTGTEG